MEFTPVSESGRTLGPESGNPVSGKSDAQTRRSASSMAEGCAIPALGEIEMEMFRVGGVAAGAKHGPERSARGGAHFREKLRMLRIPRGVHVDQRSVRQG